MSIFRVVPISVVICPVIGVCGIFTFDYKGTYNFVVRFILTENNGKFILIAGPFCILPSENIPWFFRFPSDGCNKSGIPV